MALLRQHSSSETPFRTPAAEADRQTERSSPGFAPGPLLSTELQPPCSLSASHSCLNMSQDGGQCRIDVSILEALWLTTTTGQCSLSLRRLALSPLRPRPLSRPRCFVPLRPSPRRCFLRGESIEELSLTLMKVALSLIRNWSSLFNSTSIGHRSNRAAAGATPKGGEKPQIEAKQPEGYG